MKDADPHPTLDSPLMSDLLSIYLRDVEKFAALLKEEPCQLYAHALREAASSALAILRIEDEQ